MQRLYVNSRSEIALGIAAAGLSFLVADGMGATLPTSVVLAVLGFFAVRGVYLWLIK
jgi:hypothetical protein